MRPGNACSGLPQKLNFRPNRAAQMLRSNRSKTIGIVTDGIVSKPYGGQIIQGIQAAVQPADFVCIAVDVRADPDQGNRAVSNLLAEGVEGIVFASSYPKILHARALFASVRTVYVYALPEVADGAERVILADDYGGGYRAAEAVFAAGHRVAAFVGGRQHMSTTMDRHRGFIDAARAAGHEPAMLPQVFGDYQIGSGRSITADLFRDVPSELRPTALICGNDRMALGAMLALGELGLSCPQDVSIVGFDDQPDVADQLDLTTVALPFFEMGRRAGEALLAPVPSAPAQELVPCPVVWRGSLIERTPG